MPRVTMICDFPQIQGSPQILLESNLWACLNLWEIILNPDFQKVMT